MTRRCSTRSRRFLRVPARPLLGLYKPTKFGQLHSRTLISVSTVIWCTGFEGDYSFVRVPGVLNARGQPLEHEGLTEAPGIYFAAVDFSSTRKSGLILGIAEEAQRLVGHIVARR